MSDPDTADLAPSRAEIVHRLPGRIRLRISARRGDSAFFQRVEAGLARIPGVRFVRANIRTGSLLVEHTGTDATILIAAQDQGLFTTAPPAAPTPVRRPDSYRSRAEMGRTSPLNLVALGLAGAGVLQLARGKVVGSASESLWNAYGLYVMTRDAWPLAVLVPFGLFQIARGEVLGSATSLFLYAFSARRMAQRRSAADTV